MERKLTARQNEIVEAALQLTAEGGLGNLTIRNLGEALGISEPAIYRHFRNKSEIVRSMIERFDRAVPVGRKELRGLEAVADFVRDRIEQAVEQPSLARVMFAEELFMGDPEFAEMLLEMMHRHRAGLRKHFEEARQAGEIRREIPENTLFRMVFGPVRLLVRQWGMSNGAFDLRAEAETLLETLRSVLREPEQTGDECRN